MTAQLSYGSVIWHTNTLQPAWGPGPGGSWAQKQTHHLPELNEMNGHSAGADKPAMLLHADQETSRQTHVQSAQQGVGLRVAAQTAGKHLGMDT